MANVVTYDFTDGTSGKIRLAGSTYTATTGWGYCTVLKIVLSNTQERAFFQYDTSAIPDNAVVTKVEHKWIDATAQLPTPPNGFNVYMGSFIGATLDGNVGEWNGGTYVMTQTVLTSGAWFDMPVAVAQNLVNKKGTTDVRVAGQFSGVNDQSRAWNTSRSKSQLRVTYEIPQVVGTITI